MVANSDVETPNGAMPAPPAIEPQRDALFLDLDGTLAPIRPTPEDVAVAADMLDALVVANGALSGRVAVISGRSLEALDMLLQGRRFCLGGVHGLERRAACGMISRTVASAGLRAARAELAGLVDREPRLRLEDKGLGIAVHYRAAPDLEAFARFEAAAIADRHGLSCQTGKMVAEVRERGADKGAALRAFIQEAPFADARPIFVGDDDTDEAGFVAARDLGGFGILVGPVRSTAACYSLTDVDAVRDWLCTAGAGA